MYDELLLLLYLLVCVYLAVEIANRVLCGWGEVARKRLLRRKQPTPDPDPDP